MVNYESVATHLVSYFAAVNHHAPRDRIDTAAHLQGGVLVCPGPRLPGDEVEVAVALIDHIGEFLMNRHGPILTGF